ncbi:MAG: GNAT family N-acetyltransferase [Desulfobacteraceae bacterium]|nr:GNAT family N-acetyltransferase [Desulfobacteraceae bacterium]
MSIKYSISRIKEKEIDALFEFRKKVFPENNKQMDIARWRWLYMDNPETAGSIPVWLMESNGKIIGTIGAIPVRVKVGMETCVGSFCTDYYVDEKFLGLPSFKLLKIMLAVSPLNIGMNFSGSAQRLFQKMGYSDLSANLIKVSLILTANGASLNNLKSLLKHMGKQALRKAVSPFCCEAEVVTKLPNSYQFLWEDIAPSLQVAVIKDESYLKWRYESCPSTDYRFILLKKNGTIRSLAVVLIQNQNVSGAKYGIILELLVRPGDRVAAVSGIKACVDYFEKQECSTCFSQLSNSWPINCFSIMGFSKSQYDLGAMVLAEKNKDYLNKARIPQAWTFSLGDTDRY